MNATTLRKNLIILDIKIRTYIKDNGIDKAVELTGFSQPYISSWMNGKRNWSYNQILNVADKLGL